MNDTTSIKLNNKLFKCLSTEVTFSNSVLTIDDQFQETCSTTGVDEQDQHTKTEQYTHTGNTLYKGATTTTRCLNDTYA